MKWREVKTMDKRWAMLMLAMIALVGCKRSLAPTPAPVPTMATPDIRPSGRVVASGEVVPPQETDLGFPVSGRVETVAVVKGDQVRAGQVLIVLETDLLEADVAQAEAALAAARAQVALLQAGPRPEQVAVAEAQVAAAEAALAQAEVEQTRPDLGVTQAEIATAQSQVATTMADRLVAEEMHDLTMTCVDVELGDGTVRTICPALGPYEEGARYNAQAASAAQVAAQAQLDALMRGRGGQVRAVEAGVDAAAAQRDVARARLKTAQAEAPAEQVAVAEVAISQAGAAGTTARAALDQATLRAPTAGTIVELDISPGETVMPGQAILTLVDLDRLRVETTDLSELDIARVTMGQQAEVYVEALEETVQGRIVRVLPQAETLGGDVVFRVVVELDEQPPGLRWGMSVEVEIAPD
jgi:HlyD family secretion protein